MVRRVIDKLFIWWNGATLGTLFTIGRRGRKVGTDEFGNTYYEARDTQDSYDGRKRRWVIYKGYADATKIPPDWHGWMHYTYDEPPSVSPMPHRAWGKPHIPNMTGTPFAQVPPGSLASDAPRQATAADYEAWTPK